MRRINWAYGGSIYNDINHCIFGMRHIVWRRKIYQYSPHSIDLFSFRCWCVVSSSIGNILAWWLISAKPLYEQIIMHLWIIYQGRNMGWFCLDSCPVIPMNMLENYIDSSYQDYGSSIADALELPQCYAKPSICTDSNWDSKSVQLSQVLF